MLQIAVAEDQEPVRQELCDYIRRYTQENGAQFAVSAFENGVQLLEASEPGRFDIIFLDIEMPEMDGMTAAERLRAFDKEAVIVFVTNMAQYAIRGYQVEALDYVLKPINYAQFAVKLARAVQRVQSRKGGQVALPLAGGGVRVVDTNDIYYLETRDRMLYYHTAAGEFAVRASLQSAEKQLEPYHFARCNQCYLVNLRYVCAAENDYVQVQDAKLEISRRQRAAFLAAVASYIGGAV